MKEGRWTWGGGPHRQRCQARSRAGRQGHLHAARLPLLPLPVCRSSGGAGRKVGGRRRGSEAEAALTAPTDQPTNQPINLSVRKGRPGEKRLASTCPSTRLSRWPSPRQPPSGTCGTSQLAGTSLRGRAAAGRGGTGQAGCACTEGWRGLAARLDPSPTRLWLCHGPGHHHHQQQQHHLSLPQPTPCLDAAPCPRCLVTGSRVRLSTDTWAGACVVTSWHGPAFGVAAGSGDCFSPPDPVSPHACSPWPSFRSKTGILP